MANSPEHSPDQRRPSPEESDLQIARAGGVVTVTLNRPHRHNALTEAMYAALTDLFANLATDDSARVLVIRGAGGKAFAAGNEITDFLSHDPVPYEAWIRQMMAALHALPQVTVAAIDGVCVGGGLGIATHCDLRLATPHSRFGYPIARSLGNALAAELLYRCAAVFGQSLTGHMLLTARLVDADRAYAVGALTELTEDLDASLAALLGELTVLSGVTQRAAKHQLRHLAARMEQAPADDGELLHTVYSGPDFAEGVRAFSAKEKPTFGG
ncbi:MAG: enoyl-CoA hydratase-related protein [Nostocoides sp.]